MANDDRQHTRETLANDFRGLGVGSGDTVWMHSSFKSLGRVDGGAAAVVDALEDAVGPQGLILMPSFNLVPWDDRPKLWDIDTSPSTVGWITEFFRQIPGTYRSDHCSHSAAARGQGAKEIVADHLQRDGLRSRWDRGRWGYAFGSQSPMWRAHEGNGKVLMLGVDYESATYTHVAESLYRTAHLDRDGKQGDHPMTNLSVVGEYWETVGDISHSKVGDAHCRLFSIREYVETVLAEFERNIDAYASGYIAPPDDLIGP